MMPTRSPTLISREISLMAQKSENELWVLRLKKFTKNICELANIPTAQYEIFSNEKNNLPSRRVSLCL